MIRAWPILVIAPLIGGVVFVLLSALRPPLRAIADPWLEAWIDADIPAQFRSAVPYENQHFLALDAPPPAGTTVRSYFVENANAHVVEFPTKETLLETIPEGRRYSCRVRRKDRPGKIQISHISRSGRRMLFFAASEQQVWILSFPVPRALVDQAFDAFEKAAQECP